MKRLLSAVCTTVALAATSVCLPSTAHAVVGNPTVAYNFNAGVQGWTGYAAGGTAAAVSNGEGVGGTNGLTISAPAGSKYPSAHSPNLTLDYGYYGATYEVSAQVKAPAGIPVKVLLHAWNSGTYTSNGQVAVVGTGDWTSVKFRALTPYSSTRSVLEVLVNQTSSVATTVQVDDVTVSPVYLADRGFTFSSGAESWTPYAAGRTNVPNLSTTPDGVDGSPGLLLSVASGAKYPSAQSPSIDSPMNSVFYANAQVNAPDGVPMKYLVHYWNGSSYLGNTQTAFTGNGAWQNVNLQANTPMGTTRVVLEILQNESSSRTAEIRIDNVNVFLGD